ncbi:MAG: lipid 3-deoxy-D-manno-octulosonic acid transferase, partial [Chitinophagaceae bacterium]|nr:lipid 3-deoxy-D-manno-octulosonic acid transferase [Chitinophagaceae bacterium]
MLGKLGYQIFIFLYPVVARCVSPFNEKARNWVLGRNNWKKKLQQAFETTNQQVIWFHCSSLGEFEQGRTLIEKIKKQFPQYKVLLTFFSPSGYEVQKNYTGADYIFYLPIDSKKNAADFLDMVKPLLVIFVKYDFWNFYLNEIKKRNIPLLLASALFRKDQPFFKWYGSFHRSMLRCFTHLFVQNMEAKVLLEKINFNNVTISGDTRF